MKENNNNLFGWCSNPFTNLWKKFNDYADRQIDEMCEYNLPVTHILDTKDRRIER